MNTPERPLRLLGVVRDDIRTGRYSPRTEKTCWYWIRYFIRFHNLSHPRELGEVGVGGCQDEWGNLVRHRTHISTAMAAHLLALLQASCASLAVGRPRRDGSSCIDDAAIYAERNWRHQTTGVTG